MKDFIDRILQKLPDWITGKTDVMQQKYRMKYGTRDCSALVIQKKRKLLCHYLIICILLLIVVVFQFISSLLETAEIQQLERPLYGESKQTAAVTAHLSYQGFEMEKDVSVKVQPRQLTVKEKKNVLKQYQRKLESSVLGENKDLAHISKPLNLAERDEPTGITIQWTSSKPDVISEKGIVDLIHAGKGTKVCLDAILNLDEITMKKSITVQTDDHAEAADYKNSMNDRLEKSIEAIDRNGSSKSLVLPKTIGDGVKVQWNTRQNGNIGFLLVIGALLILVCYWKRYETIDKEIKAAKDSVLEDLPEFINKLVLLLNAGLVVSSALIKIAEDYEIHHLEAEGTVEVRKRRYLYEELYEIKKKVLSSNAFMMKELMEFAQRSGIRELIRLTSIISDNWNKGSALAEKLEAESELLWINRKKMAEEKGRLAETKLTFPLVILLLVLIMVTIAPAMMEM